MAAGSTSQSVLINLAALCQLRGALHEANALLNKAIEQNPESPLAWFNRGVVLAELGDRPSALASYRRCLEIEPSHADAAYNLGLVLRDEKDLLTAAQAFRQALASRPAFHQAYTNLGATLRQLGDGQGAISAFREVLKITPDVPESHLNLAAVLVEQSNGSEAVASCLEALRIQPDHAGAHSTLGAAQLLQGEPAAAIRSCLEAVRLQPEAVEARITLANALLEQGESEAAISQFQQALALNPQFAEGHYNLGTAYLQNRDLGRAIQSYEEALRLRPDYPEASWNLALSLLLSGDYVRGWKLFDSPACLQTLPVRQPHSNPRCPPWGSETQGVGKTLLLVSEQGLGDTLQFVRFVPVLAARGLRVSLCTEEKLHGLLEASGVGVPLLSPAQGNAVSTGRWLRLLSLPRLLRVTPENPQTPDFPYLHSSPDLLHRWQLKLAPERRPLIGLHWQGNPASEVNGLRGRSLPLERFAPLAATGVGALVSLQRGSGSEQLEECSFRQRFAAAQQEISAVWEFEELAAIVSQCDLVITTDSAMAHLAGALGRPTWLLLHHQAEWRWGLEEDRSFWYPTMRLFRQQSPGDWDGVIERVAAELLAATNSKAFGLESVSHLNFAKPLAQISHTMSRRLHIGGTVAREGWEVLNAIPAEWVDHVGKAEDLSRFDDNTFAEIYASHVLEHLGYQADLPAALSEWHRVLVPEGRLMVSVPDLDTLCELYSQRGVLSADDRFAVMRMMFGGQVDQYDFHCVGLNEELLTGFLSATGFSGIRRINDFGLFADCSTMFFAGRPISLNLEAFKGGTGAVGSQDKQPLAVPATPGDNDPGGSDTPVSSPRNASSELLQSNAGWGGGYFTGLTYGAYSFGELAPNWIDFALLSQRQRPPRSGAEGSPFHYLELGSGMGLGLCLLAAAYPEGRFVGIDFHPSHIAHSQWLADELGLANVCFYEADFLELAAPGARLPFDPGAGFHYAVAHGILSWIGPEVRAALLHLAGRLLRPGGAFYCSYNTYPGWLDRSAFKALADLERQRMGAANLPLALERAGDSLERLLRSARPLAQALPQLAVQLQRINKNKRPDYLCGEFGAEHWQPFYVGQVHQLAAAHKLIYAASATLADNFPSLLPAAQAHLLAAEVDPTIRQALQDLAVNQSFRRDLFVKGPLPLSRTAQEQQLSQLLLRATGEPRGDAGQPIRIDTNLGVMVDESGRLQQLEAQLSQQPASLAELHEAMGIPPEELVMLTSLLLHAGRVGLDRGAASAAACTSCREVNSRLISLMQGGHNLGYLAAPAIGHGAQPFTLVDAFVLEALEQGLDDDILSSCVLMGLQATGVELRGADGTLLTDPEQIMRQIQSDINRFRDQTFHRLVKLGIVDPASLAS